MLSDWRIVTMKMKEIKELTAAELDAKVAELRKEHFTLRQQSKTGSLENPARIGQIRKDIARCLTEKKIRGAAVQA